MTAPQNSVPWLAYKIGDPSTKDNFTEPTCQPLSKVRHIAHLETAARIISDRKICRNLIYDESKLRTGRIQVVWLSPNDWYYGSRYGNIEFSLNWDTLIKGYNYYWVESITTYKPAACRILVTKSNYDNYLIPYNPENKDGPWWHDTSTGTHFWNGHFTLEVMVEEDILLDSISSISFTDHHEHGCCIDPKTCPYLGAKRSIVGARFIAYILSNNIIIDPRLTIDHGRWLDHHISNAVDILLDYLERDTINYSGSISAKDTNAEAMLKAFLYHIYTDKLNDFFRALKYFIQKMR